MNYLASEIMPFGYDFSKELEKKIIKLRKRDPKRLEILYKKVNEIINSGEEEIDRYKNLKQDLSDRKRVHIDKSFVLTFSFDRKNRHILFLDFDHHDKIYVR